MSNDVLLVLLACAVYIGYLWNHANKLPNLDILVHKLELLDKETKELRNFIDRIKIECRKQDLITSIAIAMAALMTLVAGGLLWLLLYKCG